MHLLRELDHRAVRVGRRLDLLQAEAFVREACGHAVRKAELRDVARVRMLLRLLRLANELTCHVGYERVDAFDIARIEAMLARDLDRGIHERMRLMARWIE